MWWVIGIFGFLLLFVVVGLTGWLLRGVEWVLAWLLQGVGNTVGCVVRILIFLFSLYVILQLLMVL